MLDSFPLTRRVVHVIGIAAAAFFTLLALAITVFYRGVPFDSLLTEGRPGLVQAVAGLVIGAGLAAVIAFIILWPTRPEGRLASLRTFLAAILARVRPTSLDIVAVSLLAGFSEELFFRGSLQPLWGIWLASLAFALAHVGGNVFARTKLAFAAYVFSMGVLFNLAQHHLGLVAAFTAHAACNMVFLFALVRKLPYDA